MSPKTSKTLIAVTDSPFHSLDPAIAALKRVDPELRMAKSPSAEDILAQRGRVARLGRPQPAGQVRFG